MLDVDGSENLRINAEVDIIYMTRENLKQTEGTSIETILCGRREKQFLRNRYGMIFLDINPACFQEVVYYLNE